MLEKAFRTATDFRPGDIPLGKALVAIPAVGLTGKLTQKLVRYIAATGATRETRTKRARIGAIAGVGLGILQAWLFRKYGKRFFGETGSEILAFGSLYGNIESAFNFPVIEKDTSDTDLSDRIANPIVLKIGELIERVRGLPAPAPEAAPAEEGLGSELGEFLPEKWPEKGAYAGPEGGRSLGSPEVDPAERTEEMLFRLTGE